MKKYMINISLLLMVFFIAFIPTLQEVSFYEKNSAEDQMISSQDTLMTSAAVMITAPNIHHKWQSKPLFLPENTLFKNLGFFPHVRKPLDGFTTDSASFIYIIMYHSNYLS